MNTNIKILAIETASEACSAALLISDLESGEVIHSKIVLEPRQHAKKILSLLDTVLKDGDVELADIDAIAFGRGPGAFTGLRIAAGIAQGIALSVDKVVIPVSTLEALALQAITQIKQSDEVYNGEIIASALDARMGEVYWGLFKYHDGHIEPICTEQVSKSQEMLAALNEKMKNNKVQVFAVGAGWDVCIEELQQDNRLKCIKYLKSVIPTASSIAKLALPKYRDGKTVSPAEAQPVYIRNNVAKKPKKQQ